MNKNVQKLELSELEEVNGGWWKAAAMVVASEFAEEIAYGAGRAFGAAAEAYAKSPAHAGKI